MGSIIAPKAKDPKWYLNPLWKDFLIGLSSIPLSLVKYHIQAVDEYINWEKEEIIEAMYNKEKRWNHQEKRIPAFHLKEAITFDPFSLKSPVE